MGKDELIRHPSTFPSSPFPDSLGFFLSFFERL
jgi:hypothetical protein